MYTSEALTPQAAQTRIYMLFTGCEVRMRKTVPETEGTVFLIRTEAAGK